MGAGCNYTNEYYDKDNKKQSIKAVWFEIDPEDEYDYEDSISNIFCELKNILNVKWEDKNVGLCTALYEISFESTYNNDGIVIKQKCIYDEASDFGFEEQRLDNLAKANFEKNYYAMINKLCKFGYKFRIATSGYTSSEYRSEK
jgi:hypothetical protein